MGCRKGRDSTLKIYILQSIENPSKFGKRMGLLVTGLLEIITVNEPEIRFHGEISYHS